MQVVASKLTEEADKKIRSVPPPPLPERPRPWRSAKIGVKRGPVSAATAAERIASEERLKTLIVRAKESSERARAAAQYARQIREAADTRRLLAGRRWTSNSDEDTALGSQPKRRRPAMQIATPSHDVMKHSCRQATPRCATSLISLSS